MVRIAIALLLAVHGFIHLIGFVVPFRLASIEGYPYTTTAAWGHLELGPDGARLVGALWLVATVAFLVAAYGVWLGASWAIGATTAAALLSVVLCILGSPTAIAGVGIDLVILVVIALIQLGATEGRHIP